MSKTFTYDEIPVGHSFEGPKIEVTREMIKEFAMASFDNNPLHWDDKFIAETTFAGHKNFDTVIGHGLMTYSFMVRTMTDWLWPDNGDHRRLEARFRSPVYPGDTVQVKVEVSHKRETRKGKWFVCDVKMINQKDEVVATGEAMAEILN
ncbi:MAG: MaoC family dehydratase [Pseudomonadota bacterium]